MTCACAHYNDGSTLAILCPVHADIDPCATKARVTGRRRKGTIRRNVCTACGWRERGHPVTTAIYAPLRSPATTGNGAAQITR